MSEITLMQGRCLTLMNGIPDQSVDLVLADPPYVVTHCFWDSVIPLKPMWEQLKRIGKLNTAFVFTASQPFTTNLISSNRKMFKYCWVWNKRKAGNFVNSNRMPMKIHEDVVVFYSRPPTYNPQKTKWIGKGSKTYNEGNVAESETARLSGGFTKYSENYERDKNFPVSIIEFKKDYGKNLLHPTQKPVALMEYMIRTHSNKGDTVLDFCMGSGTTGVACKNLERNFIGIESDKFHFGVAKRRIEETPDV